MDINTARAILRNARRDGFRTESVITIDDWADQYRFLSTEASAEPGPWRTSRVPYLRAPMRALSNTSPWERVVLMFGSQLGKTELGNNWTGYVMDRAPGPFLYVMPTVEMSKDNSKTRIDHMISSSAVLRAKVSDPRSRDSGNTTLMKEFPGGYLAMTGANSPSALSSKPVRYVYLDEIDRYPGNVGGEGDPTYLAITRTRTFSRRRILLTSTPTIKGRSRIEKAYTDSDRHVFKVPCPTCGAMQELKFGNLKWDKGDPASAWYECSEKQCRIENHDKTWMLERGEWVSITPEYKGNTIGFHLSSLYSPVGWFSWGEIAVMFRDAGKNQDLLRVFVNTVLGEAWDEVSDGVEWEGLYHRREEYTVGSVPAGGLILTAGADVQNTWIEVVVRAWGRGLESWVVDHHKFYGDTADLSAPCWWELEQLLSRQYEHDGGAMLSIRTLSIDTGGTKADGMSHTQVTYNWCRRYPPNRVMPIKGQSSLAVMVGQPRGVDVDMGNGKKKKNALKLFSVGIDIIKSELSGWLRMPKPVDGEASPPGFVHFAYDLEEEYFRSLCSETLVISETKTGRKVYEWRQTRPRNEVWDCMIYSRAALSVLQVDKFKARDWDKIEEAISGAATQQKPKAATPSVAQLPAQNAPVRRRTGSRGITL